jgi:hypothetical protein
MSKGAAVRCKTDTSVGIVRDVLKEIVLEVMQEKGWAVNTKEAVHDVYGKKFYGASIEIPMSQAADEFGIHYGPMGGSGKTRVIPLGREISEKEAAEISKGNMAVTKTPEFKARPASIGVDVHSYDSGGARDKAEDAKREALKKQIDKVGSGAQAVNNVMAGLEVLKAGGKKVPEGVREALTKKVIAGLKSGASRVSMDVSLGAGEPGAAGGITERLGPKKVGPSPTRQGPIGLTQ